MHCFHWNCRCCDSATMNNNSRERQQAPSHCTKFPWSLCWRPTVWPMAFAHTSNRINESCTRGGCQNEVHLSKSRTRMTMMKATTTWRAGPKERCQAEGKCCNTSVALAAAGARPAIVVVAVGSSKPMTGTAVKLPLDGPASQVRDETSAQNSEPGPLPFTGTNKVVAILS